MLLLGASDLFGLDCVEPGHALDVDDPVLNKGKKSKPTRSSQPNASLQGPNVAQGSVKKISNEMVKSMLATNAPIVIQQDNPKKPGSKSYDRYEKYKKATTLDEMLDLGGSRGDIFFDMERGFIKAQVIEAKVDADAAALSVPAVAGTPVRTGGQMSAEEHTQISNEWKQSMRQRSYLTSKPLSWTRLCTAMNIPQVFHGAYYKWLIQCSNGEITSEHIGVFNRKGARCRVGIRLPWPTGSLWMHLSIDRPMMNEPEQLVVDVKAATVIGREIARLVDAYERLECEIEANKTKVRAKDNVEGIVAPPKGVGGLYKISDDDRRNKFIAAMVKEISALTEMGTISHMHTAHELLELGVDVRQRPPVSTLMVFENKFSDGVVTAEDAAAKARMCVEGTKRAMKQGAHYDAIYAATPGQDSIMFFNALVVYLKLVRRAFDVGNAYGWAGRDNKLALRYPRGMEQYNVAGEALYMCLHRNTYGTPDGANLWYKERDGFWLEHFNDAEKNPGWTCRQLIIEQTLFEFTYTQPQGDRAGDSSDDGMGVAVGNKTTVIYLLAWSDDCDLAGQDDRMMKYIEDASHARWKVKSVSPSFMLGLRRTLEIDEEGVWRLTLTQEEYIEGVVAAYREHLELEGWGKKTPETPVPKGEWLSVADNTPEEESKAVLAKGYKGACGSILWVARFAHKELSEGISVACRVMSKPSHRAWSHLMQMIAWLRDHKGRGMRYSSDNTEHGLVSSCDSSNKPDPKDSKCQHCNVVQFLGGTIAMLSAKHTHTGYGSPANEYMAIRWAAAKVRKFRSLFEELGLLEVIAQPTKVYVDNSVAIQWVKTGKITDGNQYLDLAYHQPREWEHDGSISVRGIHTHDNVSDLGSKPCGPEEYSRFLMVLCGYEKWVIKHPRDTMSLT